MKYTYLKPDLENLSQGARIAYVRQLRRITQDEVSSKLGLTGECKRRSILIWHIDYSRIRRGRVAVSVKGRVLKRNSTDM